MLMLGAPGRGHESGLFLTCYSLAGYFLAGRSCYFLVISWPVISWLGAPVVFFVISQILKPCD